MKIAIVAGELSGDLLAAGLIKALRKRVPDAQFYGIAGPQMIAAGCEAWYKSESLSVMGLFEVLGHLREILAIRRTLFQRLKNDPPDLFIGVDAPDFNLGLELKLRSRGIKTVHYVSPSVWAWRRRRIKKIKKCVNRMLTLFPFEADFYQRHAVDVRFVGHPLADQVPVHPDKIAARQRLGLNPEGMYLALMPGSRIGEVQRLAEPFLKAASLCHEKYPKLQCLVPLASEAIRAHSARLFESYQAKLPLHLFSGQAHSVIEAADYVLVASGTATLEAMLYSRPMVVAYRLNRFTYWVYRLFKTIKVNRYSLPNLLAGQALVEELIQEQVTGENLAAAILRLIENPQRVLELEQLFTELYKTLKLDADEAAATAVLEVLQPALRGRQ